MSSLGDGVAAVALPLLAAALTHNALMVAGVLAAQRVPWLLVSVPAGAWADRVDRPRLLSRVDLARTAILAVIVALVATGSMRLGLLYLLAFILGSFETLFSAAAHSVLPDLVGPDGLARGNGHLLATQTTGQQVLGPAAGGVLYSLAAGVPFALDALSFLGSAGLLLGVGGRRHPRGEGDGARGRPVAPSTTLTADMRQGLRFFRRHPLLRLLSAVIGVLAFSQAMVLGVLVLFALEKLHLSHTGYGLLLGSTAIGNVAGSLLAPRLVGRWGTARLVGLGAGAAAGAYVVLGLSSSAYVAGAMLLIEALAVAAGNVCTVSLRQRLVPAELLGRVGNIFRMFIWGAIPLGALVGGGLASALGLRVPLVAAGVVQAVVVAVAYLPLRGLIAESGAEPSR